MENILYNNFLFGLSLAGWLTISILLLTFALSVFTSLATDAIFISSLIILLLANVLSINEAFLGFSNSGMITVGVLYVVVTGLKQTGALSWISQKFLGLPKGKRKPLLRLMTPVMIMSAFLNNTPVVAMFIPVVTEWSKKIKQSSSKFLIPLSYASIFGGVCTLIGTSTNLVVNGMYIEQTGSKGLHLFDITVISLPCAIAGFIYLIIMSPIVLKQRKPAVSENSDPKEYTLEMIVSESSPIAGLTIEKAGLRHLPSLFLTEIERGERIIPAVGPKEILHEKDRLIFVGAVDSIIDLQKIRGLTPATNQVFKLDTPRTKRCLIEAVVSSTCPLLGLTIREGKFRTNYNAVVLAVARHGERLKGKIGDIKLKAGDTLLLEAHPSFLDTRRVSRDFYLISGIPDSEPPRHEKAPIALSILGIMVILAATGILSMLKAALLASFLMIVTGCCSISKARRSIQWPVLIVIAAALGIGKAIDKTGTASYVANIFLNISGNNPLISLAVIYGLTTLFTEIVTNNAAAVFVFPIAIAISQKLGVNPMPFIITIMIGASSSFATPIGYQTNLMVYGPGGYKFTDFIKIGLPLNIIFWIITVSLAPIIYHF